MSAYNKTFIKIYHGLPASGKTTEAKKDKANFKLHLDDWIGSSKPLEEHLVEYFEKRKKQLSNNRNTIVIDGLLTTNSDILNMLLIIKPYIAVESAEVWIHSFEGDREACMWNNYGRDKSAHVTIGSIPYDNINLEYLRTNTGIHDIKKEVKPIIRKSILTKSMHLVDVDQNYFDSETWHGGGEWKNCYGRGGEIDEEDPVEFTALRNVLADVAPAITEEEYKGLFDESVVDTETDYNSDCYGGSWELRWHRCYIYKLEERLRSLGYLTAFERKLKIGDFLDDNDGE
jgi:hypothetical protein